MYGVNINDKPRINVHMLIYIYNFEEKNMDRNCNKNFIGHITVFLWPWTAEFVVYRPVILIWIFLGINFVLRKVGNSITSYEEIKQDGDNWELNITSTFKNAHLKFKLGEEFDETTLDGRKCKVSKEKKRCIQVHNKF